MTAPTLAELAAFTALFLLVASMAFILGWMLHQ